MTNKCAVCDSDTEAEFGKIKDSFYGIQFLCELACWDAYDGWYCDTCQLLHDHDTTMESDNSCIKTETPNACNCDECECKNQDDYTEDNGTCEDCFRDCQITEGSE